MIKSLFKLTIGCLVEMKMNLIHLFLLSVDINLALVCSHKECIIFYPILIVVRMTNFTDWTEEKNLI